MRQEQNIKARHELDTFSFQHHAYADADMDDWEDDTSKSYLHDPNQLDVESIVTVTARLAQVLAEEADLLEAMKIKDIEKLQKEKNLLIDALESQKRYIEHNPHLLHNISDEDALEMAQIIEIFQKIMKENYRRLLIAKEVNQRMIEAIADVITEAAHNGHYDNTGRTDGTQRTVSVTLNKTI